VRIKMKLTDKAAPWWLNIIAGIILIAVGIFLLAFMDEGNDFLAYIVGIGVFAYCIYNIFKALQNKNDNRLFIPYLAHALLDLVLFILVITIPSTQTGKVSQLIGIIISCWLIIFGFFEIINRKPEDANQHRVRNGLLLILTGIAMLLILLLIQLNYVIFLGIVAILVGIIKNVQGLMLKVKTDERTTGGRSNLF
jgi:uncharacterized membrane protein HdeD (DUF308 family)